MLPVSLAHYGEWKMLTLKARVYCIVICLLFVAVLIGCVGIYAMRTLYAAMGMQAEVTLHVSLLKDVRSEMQNVLISVREMVLTPSAADKAREKLQIDKRIKD